MSNSSSEPGLRSLVASMQANEADFLFEIPPLDPTHTTDYRFRVLDFSGTEAVSRFFRLELTLVTDVFDVDLEGLLGVSCWLTLRTLQGDRHIAGIIEQCEQLAVGRRYSQYRVVLSPSLTPLRLNRTSRVFKSLSTPEIVASVLKGAGFSSDHFRTALRSTYPRRDFCVQYQESDHDFLCRLLEEEGISFFFDHVKHPDRDLWTDVWVLTDGEQGHEPLTLGDVVTFRDEATSTVQAEETIYRLQARAGVRPGRVSMRDYRFKQPDLNLETSAEGSGFQKVEVYYYPGEYVDPHLGKRLTKVRHEAIAAQRLTLSGYASRRDLQPGHTFQLDLHPRSDFNRRLMLLSVTHDGQQPQALLEETGADQLTPTSYRAEFSCLPAETPYRPPRTTPRPSIPGIQTARVIGPRSEEVYCDEYGRVLVSFHWDRSEAHHESSSCWIRVNQGWAGQGYGMQFIPRVGHEVLVQFLEGDPDRPVIVGRVYNDRQRVPYPLPEHKTRSTLKTRSTPDSDGFNELRFEDRRDQEEIYLHAQKDLNAEVLHNESRDIGNDAALTVGHDRTREVGNDERVKIGHVLHKQVGSDEIRELGGQRLTTITHDDNRVLMAGSDYLTVLSGDQTQDLYGNRTVYLKTGDDRLLVTAGNSITQINQTQVVTIEQQDQLVTVEKGNAVLSVCKDRNVAVQEGDYNLQVVAGNIRQSAQTDLILATQAGDTLISAGNNLQASAGEDLSIEGSQVFINAGKLLVLRVGANEIRLSKEGISLNGLTLGAEAASVLTLKGALVKVN